MKNNIEVDVATVPGIFEKARLLAPEKQAIFDGKNRSSYREIHSEAIDLASGLVRLGIQKGDCIAVCLPNWNEFLTIFMAIAKVGAILIPLNTQYRLKEMRYILYNSGAKAIFCTSLPEKVDPLQLLLEAKEALPALEHLISVRLRHPSLVNYDDLLETGRGIPERPETIIYETDIAVILYTSGTTGEPKGVMLAHENLVKIAATAADKMKCTPDDVFLIPMPLFHIMGLMFMLRSIICQGRLVLMEKFKAEKALELIQNEGVTIHPGVPTMFILELNSANFAQYNLASLRTGEMAAAPCPVEIVRRIKSEMGCNVLVAYGMTETSANLTMTDFEDEEWLMAETVGKALPGAEIKIVNEDRVPVARGEVGELACRSAGLMKGYYHMEEETFRSIDGAGWFYSGDLATMDEAGYVRIVGRKKEMIIRGGYNIYPREVEEVFYQHPGVLEVAVIGLPDTVLGEISCAVIRLKQAHAATEKELSDFAAEKLAGYKVPTKIVFLNKLPMTSSGKILKRDLSELIQAELKGELR